MNKGVFRKSRFSINLKLFLWFWLIIIISVVTTKQVSELLAQNEVQLPLHIDDDRKLNFFYRQLTRKSPTDIQSFVDKIPKRRGRTLLVEEIGTSKVFSNSGRRYQSFTDYIRQHKILDLSSLHLPEGRLTGPKLAQIGDKQYRLYIADKSPKPRLSSKILQLPIWMRLIIPVLISFLLCWVLARTLSRPIYRIQAAANELGDGDLSKRVNEDAKRKDELGSLAQSFNSMAEKLENSLSAQQRLIADVSHELRSPMTRLQMALALAENCSEKPEELKKHLARCEKEVGRLDQMVGNVLSLSRLENALYALNVEQIELSSLLQLNVQDAQYIADEKGIKIEINSSTQSVLSIDVQLMSSAISNVLNNGIKYSPDNTQILVNVFSVNDSVILEISDNGPGVSTDNIDRLFEPFYRVADARDRKTGGTGLGLAIAKQAVLAHKGTISAKNGQNGLIITIEIPTNI